MMMGDKSPVFDIISGCEYTEALSFGPFVISFLSEFHD